MRVLLVDDQKLFRQGLASLLGGQLDFEVVGEAGSVKEAISKAHDLQPDLILMDFVLPDGTGLDATHAILAEKPRTNIVFLTVHEEDSRLFAAVRSGAKGYLLKNVSVSRLLNSLRGVERNEAAITPALTGRIMQEFSRLAPFPQADDAVVHELTERELDVLQELATGATNRQIAARLFISEYTVKNHVSNILAKLELPNRRQAAYYAHRHNLSRPSVTPS